jgi:hypothetical protein
MKYVVNLPFLWFKRGEVITEDRLRNADKRYLMSRGIIEEHKTVKAKKATTRKVKNG